MQSTEYGTMSDAAHIFEYGVRVSVGCGLAQTPEEDLLHVTSGINSAGCHFDALWIPMQQAGGRGCQYDVRSIECHVGRSRLEMADCYAFTTIRRSFAPAGTISRW